MPVLLGCLGAFLIGAVPFALLLVRALTGRDVRKYGSGNSGATNASRIFSTRSKRTAAFLTIYALDALKGYLPTALGPELVGEPGHAAVAVGMGASAVLGHCFSPFLRFRGGKGVATTSGVFLALEPIAFLVAIGAFFLVLKATGRVFLGSLALGLSLALAVILVEPSTAFGSRLPITVLSLLAAAFLVWTHRSNIREFRAPVVAPREQSS